MSATDDHPSDGVVRPGFVSVIVPHYSDLKGLDTCLQALERQSYPRDGFEIVVADNASPEGKDTLTAVVRGRARLVVVHKKGAGPARNGGVEASCGSLLAFTDCDCVPEAGWLAAGIEALARHDIVGGPVEIFYEDASRPTPVEAWERIFGFENDIYIARDGYSVTANLLCPRAIFDGVGDFATGVSEDTEWGHRALAAGFTIGFAPAAIVKHPARRTWAELKKKWRRLNSETFAGSLSKPGGRWLWLARASLLPLSAVFHTPKVLTSRLLTGPTQRLGATWILFRLRLWRFWNALDLLFGVKTWRHPPRSSTADDGPHS